MSDNIKLDVKVDQRLTKTCEGVNTVFVKQQDDTELGVIFGWGMVSTINGEPFIDSQNDHIPEAAMLKASFEFMKSSRILGVQHEQDGNNDIIKRGTVAFAFPVTEEIKDAFGMDIDRTGLLVGVTTDDPEILEKARTGEFTGFSIGGSYIRNSEFEG